MWKAKRGMSLLSFIFIFPMRTSSVHLRDVAPETPATTAVSIPQSLSAPRVEHAYLLEEYGADRAALRQRETVGPRTATRGECPRNC